jgi:hypothetical protein
LRFCMIAPFMSGTVILLSEAPTQARKRIG